MTVVAAAALAFCMSACNNNAKTNEAEEPVCDTTAVCDTIAHECASDSAKCCKADTAKCCKAEMAEHKGCCKKAEGQQCEKKCEKKCEKAQ